MRQTQEFETLKASLLERQQQLMKEATEKDREIERLTEEVRLGDSRIEKEADRLKERSVAMEEDKERIRMLTEEI